MAASKIIKIILVIWCVLWLNFIARDLYKKGLLGEYKILAQNDAEGKRAHTYGERFYEFLKFAKDYMPRETFYDFAGKDDFSLEMRRGVYYLYPGVKTKHPVYILVYDRPGYLKDGFEYFAKLDNGRFMLKRR